MTSKLVVNTIEADTGISSVSFASSISMDSTSKFHFSAAGVDIGADTNISRPAAGVLGFNISGAEKLRIDTNGHLNTSGIVTAANFKSGVTNVHNLGVTLAGGQLDVGSNIKIGTAGVVTATSFVGSGANLTSLPTQITINNNSNGRVITATGNANELDSQANLTFSNSSNDPKLTITGSGHAQLFLTNTSGADHTGVNFGDSADTNAGMIQYSNSNNAMQFHTNGTEKLRITSDGKLGINYAGTPPSEDVMICTAGQASPAGLTLSHLSGGNRYGARLQTISGTNQGIVISGLFNSSYTERLRIDSSGRLGLGTNNPDTLFHIKAASGSTLQRFESSSYSSYIAQIQANENVGNGSLAGNLYLRGQSGVQMSANNGTATQFTLDSSALTLKGTTDGVLNLDTSDSRGSFIRFQQAGATEAWVGCGEGLSLGTSTTLAFRSDADIRIRTGAEEHVTITTEGMFAAKGQAGNWIYGNHPANYTGFHQFSSSKNGDWMMQFRQEHHNGLGFNMRVANNANNEAIALYRENVSTYGFKVYQNGNVQNSNNSYGQLSDITLKENITDSNSQWDDIKAVKVRNYNFKDDPDKVNMIGVVAQEIETVSPKLVWEDKDGIKGVAYSVLYMKAIKGLQEAMTRIETLEAKVDALESS